MKLGKRIAALGAAVVMMMSMSAVGASAAVVYGKFTAPYNETTYKTTIKNAANKSFDTYIKKKGKHNVPGQNVTVNVKGTLNNVSVSLAKTDNKTRMKFETSISLYNKKTKKNKRLDVSDITTVNAGCGCGYKRNAKNKYYRYDFVASSYFTNDADPFTSRCFYASVNQ